MGGAATGGKTAEGQRRKRRSPEEILDRLMTAAAQEFAEAGYVGATTAAIARRGDVTEAQLFRYFPTKAALFREAVFKPLGEHINRFNAQNAERSQHAPDRDAQAHIYIGELQAFLREHARLLMALLVAQAYAPDADASGMNSLDRYFDYGAAMMTKRLDGDAGIDPQLMVRVSFAAVLASVMWDDWLFPAGMATRAEKDAAIERFVLHGIDNRAGS